MESESDSYDYVDIKDLDYFHFEACDGRFYREPSNIRLEEEDYLMSMEDFKLFIVFLTENIDNIKNSVEIQDKISDIYGCLINQGLIDSYLLLVFDPENFSPIFKGYDNYDFLVFSFLDEMLHFLKGVDPKDRRIKINEIRNRFKEIELIRSCFSGTNTIEDSRYGIYGSFVRSMDRISTVVLDSIEEKYKPGYVNPISDAFINNLSRSLKNKEIKNKKDENSDTDSPSDESSDSDTSETSPTSSVGETSSENRF